MSRPDQNGELADSASRIGSQGVTRCAAAICRASSASAERVSASLSPGERTRACLATFQAAGTNTLVLDEPTNHLDLPAIEQLEAALAAYDGTLLLVTHDRRLLEAVELDRTIALGTAVRQLSSPPSAAIQPSRSRASPGSKRSG